MWTREELKIRAKASLKLSYWKAFLVSLVLAFATGSGGGGGSGGRGGSDFGTGDLQNMGDTMGPNGDMSWLPVVLVAVGIFLVVMVFVLALRVFLGFPLEVGGRKFFVESTKHEFNLGHLGYVFSGGSYLNVVITLFMRGLFLFLWTLLLIIPGIIKGYAYRMVPYILADNPAMNYKEAIALSNKMTDGEKLDMWVLDLSFIGWYLLGALALLIGILFVHPYYNATQAELYIHLRKKPLIKGIVQQVI